MVAGAQTAMARLAAKGFQGPGLKDAIADSSGCLSLRSPHLQAISLSAPTKRKLWSVGIKDACQQADGFTRAVFSHGAPEWGPSNACRFWILRALTYGLGDDPVAIRRSPQEGLVNSALPLTEAGLQKKASFLDPL